MTNKTHMMIIGANSPIAIELIKRLDHLNYRFTLVDIQLKEIEVLARALNSPATTIQADLNQMADVERLRAYISENEDPLDQIFYNAGALTIGPSDQLSPDQVDLQLNVNLRAAIILIAASVAPLRLSKRAHILATVSMGGIIALKNSATYSAGKFGLRGYLCALDQDLSQDHIQVSGFYPSGVDTPMLRYEAMEGGNALNFLNQPLTPGHIASAIIKVLERPRLEVYLPYSDSLSARLVSVIPWLIKPILPWFEKRGERGRRKFLSRISENGK